MVPRQAEKVLSGPPFVWRKICPKIGFISHADGSPALPRLCGGTEGREGKVEAAHTTPVVVVKGLK